MIGDSLLFVPKLHSSNKKDSDLYDPLRINDKHYEVEVLLPYKEIWYNYFSKTKETESSEKFTKLLGLNDNLLYVRGGRILPIKLHNTKLSLIRSFFMPIRLEIFLDRD